MAVVAANLGAPGQYDGLVVFAFVVAFADSYGTLECGEHGSDRVRNSERDSEREKEVTLFPSALC